MLKIIVLLQIFFISVFAVDATQKISDLSNAIATTESLFSSDTSGGTGTIFMLIKYIIVILGLIFMAIGINDTFIAEDRGGENKKGKGIMKIIGGAFFIAIMLLYTFVAG